MEQLLQMGGRFTGFFVILMLWSLVWKGMALWKSARLNKQTWFMVFLVVNTLGILEILYLYVFSKKQKIEEIKPLQ